MVTSPALPHAPKQALDDPYPYFAWLREHEPVHREHRRREVWSVSRYDDVRALLTDPRLSKRPELVPGYTAGPEGLNNHLVHADPPAHTRLRGLVNTAFVPRRVAALEPLITRTARTLVDRFGPRPDLVTDFALPLTFTVICTILGVSASHNTPKVRSLLAASVTPDAPSQDGELREFLNVLVAEKRAAPGAEDDLLAALVHANQGGDWLTDDELVSTAYLLLLVGHDTTVGLIGNGMLALLRHPDQAHRLRHDPALMPTAVEELLRYDSPVRDATFRVAIEDIPLHSHVIPAGAIVCLLIGSANRDERKFANADVLNLGRQPNDHIAFGRGAHFCVGAALSRLEGSLAIGTLLRHLPDLRLAGPPTWRPSRVMRSLEHLPVVRR
nr:cytochrome P450 [Kibdelosporangium sp. MJ126-NF4]